MKNWLKQEDTINMYKAKITNVTVLTAPHFKYNNIEIEKLIMSGQVTATSGFQNIGMANNAFLNNFLVELISGKDSDEFNGYNLLSKKFKEHLESDPFMVKLEKQMKDKFEQEVEEAVRRKFMNEFSRDLENGITHGTILNHYYDHYYSVGLEPSDENNKRKIRLAESTERYEIFEHDVATVRVDYQVVEA